VGLLDDAVDIVAGGLVGWPPVGLLGAGCGGGAGAEAFRR
jgi:hypothetical protein